MAATPPAPPPPPPTPPPPPPPPPPAPPRVKFLAPILTLRFLLSVKLSSSLKKWVVYLIFMAAPGLKTTPPSLVLSLLREVESGNKLVYISSFFIFFYEIRVLTFIFGPEMMKLSHSYLTVLSLLICGFFFSLLFPGRKRDGITSFYLSLL